MINISSNLQLWKMHEVQYLVKIRSKYLLRTNREDQEEKKRKEKKNVQKKKVIGDIEI